MAKARRVWAISGAETRLFVRNPTILLTAIGLPLLGVVFVGLVGGGEATGGEFTAYLINTLLQWALLLVIYYNLTTIFVSRREDGVFQRMATGEATSWEGAIGSAVPSIVVLVVQIIVGSILASAWFGSPAWTNPVYVVIAVVLGCTMMVALAAWTSSFTATVESAQYSTLPLFFALMILSGVSFSLALFPEALQRIAARTPLYAVGDLMSLGMSGTSLEPAEPVSFAQSWSAGFPALATLIIWTVIFIWLARSTMRFVKRR